MENNLTISKELMEMFNLTNPELTITRGSQPDDYFDDCFEAEVSIPVVGAFSFAYDTAKLTFSFHRNHSKMDNGVTYFGKVTLVTLKNTGAPIPRVKSTALTHPNNNSPLHLIIYNNVVNILK